VNEQIKYPLRVHKGFTSTGATVEWVKTSHVPPGEVWFIQTFYFENETSTSTEVRLALEKGEFRHWIFQQQNPPPGVLYWFADDFILVEGERLSTRWTGTTAGDSLHIYATGYKMKTTEGGFV